MSLFQLILAFIGGIFFSISLFHFARSLFVVRKIDRYFFFFLVTLFSSLFILFQLLLSFPSTDENILFLHRLKMMSAGLGLIFWYYLLFDVAFKSQIIPHIFAFLSAIFVIMIPFDFYLSYPVRTVTGLLGPVFYEYRMGTVNILYIIHALLLLTVFGLTPIISLFTSIRPSRKLFVFFGSLPVVLGGLNDYGVTTERLQRPMLSEFFMLFFILLVFGLFLVDEFRNYQKLEILNEELETKVKNRTQELEVLNQQLKKAAATDQLTGLNNRTEMENKIKDEIKRGLRYHQNENYFFSILFIDLDNFKYFNDSFGHLVGDILLKKFADLLLDEIRDIDHAGRFGGDEFIVILPETRARSALHLVRRIQSGIKQREHFLPAISRLVNKTHLIPSSRKLSCSIGISEFSNQNKKNLQDLLKEADDALYLAKHKGKNQAVIWQNQ